MDDNLTLETLSTSLDWSAWVTAIATLVLAGLTFRYVLLTRKLLEVQSDPCVIISVVHDEDRPTFLQLIVKNIGTGLAHDISFKFSKPIPARAFGIDEKNAKDAELMDRGPLIDGIPALGPGETRKLTWGQYGGLQKALGDEPIIATCYFKKNDKSMRPINCKLDIKSFEGTDANEKTSVKIAKEIGKISKNIEHLASGSKKLKIEVVDMPKKNNETEE